MELRPDVSLVVVVNKDEKLLVIRRSEQSTDTGRWESPVGHRDSGETAREAALREVKEETGLSVTLFPESFDRTNPDGKKIAIFMGKADTEDVKLDPKEHDSF
jgi:tRNA nucleotidyltransferase (CCA-adding enzyme)